ncbi:chemotaxis protein CheW [Oscillatoria sp. CS-180]|uniref:chemotaxis protein CheW n=1 Tax=Oscillatoria sp. CS-180 TaxID=3021720 RepID=UPI00232B5615|nr:chemotaxis protein CheW [Oscillatoria sp. CS-180]MDB9525281.1 chemotaxis protein CheW [Oscillatoria sp. CS-180]
MDFNNDSLELTSSETQYILTQVGMRRVAFPAESVAGILLAERSHILSLPFYHEAILGVVHHQGQLVALMMLQQLLEDGLGTSREVFNAVQLTASVGAPGLGLIVDQLLGNCSEEQLSNDGTITLFKSDTLPPELWQPKRWIPLAS